MDSDDSDIEGDGSAQNWDNVDCEEAFWNALDTIVNAPHENLTHDIIDDTLRSYLELSIQFKNQYLCEEYDVGQCSYVLLSSSLFTAHSNYVRRQIIYGLLQEDTANLLYIIASILLIDGRENEIVFQMMNDEGAFSRLLELVRDRNGSKQRQLRELEDANENNDDGELLEWESLHRLLMVLMYEMSRIQRIKVDELMLVEDEFVMYLFKIIEELSDDVNDPYHYPVIRVLLVLNEQFMVSAHDPAQQPDAHPITNKVIKILSTHGSSYKTFGENIILVLNRESETSLQLLTLKLLYLLFTTPSTQEYFYTNDLRVLVDILIRNLLDLPEEALALRHTYLRVLYPLLAHTQLRYPPHYKRDEIRKLLSVLVRGSSPGREDTIRHFEDADETTQRLVNRCNTVEWLQDPEHPFTGDIDTAARDRRPSTTSTGTVDSQATAHSPTSPLKRMLPKLLGMNLEPARESSLSVLEVAAQTEKPGVMTPSRKTAKQRPPPPKARRTGRAPKVDKERGKKEEEIVEKEEAAAAVRLAEQGENSLAAAVVAAGEAATSTLATTIADVETDDKATGATTTTDDHQTRPHEQMHLDHIHKAHHPPRSSSLASTASTATTSNGVVLPSQSRTLKAPPEPPKARRWRAKPPPAVPVSRKKTNGDEEKNGGENENGNEILN